MRGLCSDEREIPMFHAENVHSSKAQISKSKTQTSLHQDENMASVERGEGLPQRKPSCSHPQTICPLNEELLPSSRILHVSTLHFLSFKKKLFRQNLQPRIVKGL